MDWRTKLATEEKELMDRPKKDLVTRLMWQSKMIEKHEERLRTKNRENDVLISALDTIDKLAETIKKLTGD